MPPFTFKGPDRCKKTTKMIVLYSSVPLSPEIERIGKNKDVLSVLGSVK